MNCQKPNFIASIINFSSVFLYIGSTESTWLLFLFNWWQQIDTLCLVYKMFLYLENKKISTILQPQEILKFTWWTKLTLFSQLQKE